MGLTSPALAEGLASMAAKMEDCADELNALDAEIGDGDLGVTMVRMGRGMGEILDDLPADMGTALMKCVQAITKVSGSSYATLVATALMSAAKACKGRHDVPWSDLPPLLGGAAEAMMVRGKSHLDDKTVIDAIHAAAIATNGFDDPRSILAAAGVAIDETLDRLRDQPSRVGRARIWAEKSVGRDDPGMVAFRRMIDGLSGP
jgi:phosphoenolpyruvate---glycerone phosphotransferase subunit DhaL